jgi:hypothetical protein
MGDSDEARRRDHHSWDIPKFAAKVVFASRHGSYPGE